MTESEKPLTMITTHWIYRLSKTTITIGVPRQRGLTNINLPINTDVYKTMLKALANPKLSRWLPLVFFIDNNGTAYKVLPRELYEKQKAEQQAEPDKNDTS
jgi:hypothetical protein